MEDIRPQAEARGLTVQLHCEQSATVSGDSARLQHLVSNLLVNAVKFTPKGGAIALTIRAVQGQAELDVSDTGEGISADFLPHLFERFQQQDSSNRRKHGGLGLGLSIGADLVRLHGGSISAYSAGPGRGARFTVRMPLTTAATAPQAPVYVEPQPLELTMRKHLVGMNIVVIDDEEDVRATVARLLVQIGADVVVLDAGTTIEEVLRRKRPDLLLIDIGMPDEDGYTLIRRIRKLSADSGGDTPAISLTAFAREEDRVRALAAGFQEHLTKPVDLPRLTNAILSTVRFSRSKAVLE
jgi:CheY-like chemotaxis protein/anti-sigma regulatory factor (Ser/Thr protein kinase)